MSCEVAIYPGEDKEFIVDYSDVDVNFADLSDVVVGIVVADVLRKTCRKVSPATPGQAVVVNPDNAKQGIFRVMSSETVGWPKGAMMFEISTTFVDPDFSEGRRETNVFYAGEVGVLKTANS